MLKYIVFFYIGIYLLLGIGIYQGIMALYHNIIILL